VRRGWSALVVGVLLLGGCSTTPVLLDEDDFEDVTIVEQNTRYSLAPGWTWCEEMSPNLYTSEPVQGTWLEVDGGPSVGATLLDRSGRGQSAEDVVADITAQADQCVLSSRTIGSGRFIEPLDGLEAGAAGWRTEDPDGVWGEFVVVPLDGTRVLAYGFATDRVDPPVDLDDLRDLAVAGAERFPASEG
jgi:hypothetical protein